MTQIDIQRDRFESQYVGGASPQIKDYLTGVSESMRPILLGELIELDIYYRTKRGERPHATEYEEQFPNEDVRSILKELSQAKGLTQQTIRANYDTAEHVPTSTNKDATSATNQNSDGPAFSERYHIKNLHARGGIGEVYVAFDSELHRRVALKKIQPGGIGDPRLRNRFLVEAEITGQLEHPGVVPVYGLGKIDGQPAYVMRFLEGDGFDTTISKFHEADWTNRRSQRTLRYRALIQQLIDVCHAISYAHSRNIVHRDIKPANIMLGRFGETLVVDWGLAKVLGGEAESNAEMQEPPLIPQTAPDSDPTAMGSVVGTPAFMSPEQASGRIDLVNKSSDIFSLGATLYFLLTNQTPHRGKKMHATLQDAQAGRFDRPRSVMSGIPRPLESICLQAMALEPDDRYATCDDMAQDLENWLADAPVEAHTDSLVERGARFLRQHRSWAIAGSIALMLIALSSTVAALVVNQARRETAEANRSVIGKNVALEAARATLDSRNQELQTANSRLTQSELRLTNQLARTELEVSEKLSGPDRLIRLAAALQKANTPELQASIRSHIAYSWDATPTVFYQMDKVSSIDFSPDGTKIAAGSDDHSIVIWDLERAKVVRKLSQQASVRSVVYHPRGTMLATAGSDKSVRLWEPQSGDLIRALRHDQPVNSVAFNHDGTRMVTACFDHTAIIWDTATGARIGRPMRHNRWVRSAVFGIDGKTIFTGCWDKTGAVRFWDETTREESAPPIDHGETVFSVSIDPTGRMLASGSFDFTARVWDTETQQPMSPVLQHDFPVWGTKFSPDGLYLLTASEDGSARIWDVDRWQQPDAPLVENVGLVRGLSFTRDGRLLGVGSGDGKTRVWRRDIAPEIHILNKRVRATAINATGDIAAFATGNSSIEVFDVRQMQQIGEISAVRATLLAFDSSGAHLASVNDNNQIEIWDVVTRQRLGAPFQHAGKVNAISFSTEPFSIVTGTSEIATRAGITVRGNGIGRVIDMKSGKQLGSDLIHADAIHSVSCNADGSLLVIGDEDNIARVWNSKTGECLIQELRHEDQVHQAQFSPNEAWIATASFDGTVRIWDVESGTMLGQPLRHIGKVENLAINHEGTLLAAISEEKVYLWDVHTQKRLRDPWFSSVFPTELRFSPDGQELTAVGRRGIEVWQLPSISQFDNRQIVEATLRKTGLDIDNFNPLSPAAIEKINQIELSFRMDGNYSESQNRRLAANSHLVGCLTSGRKHPFALAFHLHRLLGLLPTLDRPYTPQQLKQIESLRSDLSVMVAEPSRLREFEAIKSILDDRASIPEIAYLKGIFWRRASFVPSG